MAVNMLEEIWGIGYAEWGWGPHDFAYNRRRGIAGYKNPDDVRSMHFGSFNRKNKFRDHYKERTGDNDSMAL